MADRKPSITSKGAIWIIFATVVLDITGIGIIFPIMPDLLEELGFKSVSNAAVWGGVLATSYALMQFLFSPIIGNISDSIGRRKVILIALFTLSIDYLILGFSKTFTILIVGRVIAGIAGGTVPTATAYLADISASGDRAKNFGLIGAAFGIGFILGPALGGILGEYNSRAPFFLSAALTGINFFCAYFILPESLPLNKRRNFSWTSLNPFLTLWESFVFKTLRVSLICYFIISIAHWVYPAIWSYWCKEVFGWGSGMIGVSLALYGVGISLVQGLVIRMAFISKLGPRWTVTISLLMGTMALVALGFTNLAWLVFLIIPFAALSELLTPTLGGFLSNQVADEAQGKLQGVLASLSAVTTIISPLLMTSIFNISSSTEGEFYLPGMPFLFAAALLALTVIPLSLVMRSKEVTA